MPVRVFAYGAAGALLGLVAPIVLCAILAVMLGGPSSDLTMPGAEATGADAIVAYAPLLALIGSVAGAVLGVVRATRRRRPSRFVN
jgi:hypothetical protein